MAILKIRDSNGNIQEILAIKGDSYILTEADKMEIANMVAALVVSPANLTKVSEFENDAGYLNEQQVQAMIENAIVNTQDNGSHEAVIINFSIEDFQFQAEEGMTWREWVNSEYNTEGACVYNEGTDTIRYVEYSLNVLRSDTPVRGSDTIISGHFYYLS